MGYGIFVWKMGDDDRLMFSTLAGTPGLSGAERAALMRSYLATKRERERQQRFIRALTHGMIAALNFYGATQQKNNSVKNALIFVGGVNTLAVFSYTF